MKRNVSNHIAFIAWIIATGIPFVYYYWIHVMEFNLWSLAISAVSGIFCLFIISEYSGYIKDTSKYQLGYMASFYNKRVLVSGKIKENFMFLHQVEYRDGAKVKTKWLTGRSLVWVRSF